MSNKTARKLVNKVAYFFKWRKAAARLLKPFWRWRAKKIAGNMLPYIPVRARIIDIGAGNGLVAEEIAQKKDAKVTLIDVIDWNISKFPLEIFDGGHIPFDSKRFDIALLIDVIHHAEDKEALVKEAFRVAKKVIISEEVREDKRRKFLSNIGDNIQVILYGMPVGNYHRNKEDWLDFLKKISPSVTWMGDYKDPNPHALFMGG